MQSATRQLRADERRLHQTEGVSRIVDFSNGVMGFAITLLVLDIRVPEVRGLEPRLQSELLGLWPHYIAYLISFFVIGENWIIYNRIFSHIERYDEKLYWFDLLFLFFIVLLPFPTGLVSVYPGQKLPALVYAGVITCVVFSRTLIWWYATRGHRLVHENLDPGFVRRTLAYAVTLLCGFIISAIIAFFAPIGAIELWILLVIFSLFSRLGILYHARHMAPVAPPPHDKT